MRNIFLYCCWMLLMPVFLQGANIEKPSVVATTTIIEDIAKQIAKDKIALVSLVPVGGDPHLYEPIHTDAIKITEARLILKNGLTLEGWLDEFIENSGTQAIIKTVTTGIAPIQSSTYANSPDPHAWMDAANGIIYAQNIKDALIALDAANADFYNANFEDFKKQLESVDQQIRQMIDSIPESQRVLITSHDAFQYFGRKYGLRLESILGTSTDSEAQTSDINRLYKVISETKVPAIFIESTINPKTMQQIAKDTKVKIGGKLYADSLGQPDSPGGTYVGMLLSNTKNIVNGLLGRSPENSSQNEGGNGSTNWIFMLLIGALLIGGSWWMFRKMN